DAFKESWSVTKPHLWTYVLWVLLVMVVAYAGSILVIGSIATVPIAFLMIMLSYRDAVGIPGALPPATAGAIAAQAGGAPPVGHYGAAGPPMAAANCPACGRPVAAGAVACPAC